MHRAPLLLLVALVGCRASVDVPAQSPPPVQTQVSVSHTRSEADMIRDFGDELNLSHDAIREAEILRRLHAYLASHDLLFQVRKTREVNEPDETRVDVFRGQQPISTFTFYPRDERNLSLLGQ